VNGSDFKEIITSFDNTQLVTILKYIRDWNTNGRHSLIAQKILYFVLQQINPMDLPNSHQIKELITGVTPYTDKHFQRIDKLLQKSFFIDYTLQEMHHLIPLDENTTIKNNHTQNKVVTIQDNENMEVEPPTITTELTQSEKSTNDILIDQAESEDVPLKLNKNKKRESETKEKKTKKNLKKKKSHKEP